MILIGLLCKYSFLSYQLPLASQPVITNHLSAPKYQDKNKSYGKKLVNSDKSFIVGLFINYSTLKMSGNVLDSAHGINSFIPIRVVQGIFQFETKQKISQK